MDRITKVTAFKTADGKLHEDAGSARSSVLRQLVEEAVDAEGVFGDGQVPDSFVVQFFVDNFDKISRKLDQVMGSVRA